MFLLGLIRVAYGLPIPFYAYLFVPCHSLAYNVANTEIVLSLRETLLGRFLIPIHRILIV